MGKCLFIGGTNDGAMVDVTPEGIPFWRLPQKIRMRDLPPHDAGDGKTASAPLLVETYNKSTFFTSNKQGIGRNFDLYLLDQMSHAEAMMRLIDGYRKP